LSAEVLSEVGVDITDQTPKLIDPQLVRDVDVVVTLGREAHVDPMPGTQFENWDTDEPSERTGFRQAKAAPVAEIVNSLT
jgi:arsenate-mycothiol transferase